MTAAGRASVVRGAAPPSSRSVLRSKLPARHALAFAGLWLFTLLLYLRPNDVLPIGTFPIVRIVGIALLIIYVFERFAAWRSFTDTPVEVGYVLGLMALMLLGSAVALDPQRAFDGITDTFLKVVIIFVVMISVITSLKRLRWTIGLVTLCGAVIAAGTLCQFMASEYLSEGYRASGLVSGIFGNPNDLALALNILIPLAIGTGLSARRRLWRVVCFVQAGVMTVAVLMTYSRSGFVTLLAGGILLAVVLKRDGRRAYRWLTALAVAAVVAAPAGLGTRIASLYDTSLDPLGTLSARQEIVVRAIEVAGLNPKVWLLGVGVDNFPIVSIHELVAHNAYLQVFTEVGLPALILYVLFMIRSIRRAARVASAQPRTAEGARTATLAGSIKVSLLVYAIGSLFASVAYLWYLYYAAGFAICLDRSSGRGEPAMPRWPRPR